MKKLLLATFALVFAVSFTSLQAQNCNPDPMLADSTVGVYPLPDLIGSPTSSLNSGCVGMAYEQLFTAVVPDSLYAVFNNGTMIDAELLSITVDDITDLPIGITYACDPPDCIFLQNTIGCVVFSGTPTTAGDFLPIVETTASIYYLADLDVPINFPAQAGDATEIFPGEYKIVVHAASSSEAACLVSVNDVPANVLGVQQNAPNPFNAITNITVDSKESGAFDFKVYSLIGELVYSEVLTLSAGENIVQYDGSNLGSGMYFYAIGQGNAVVTKRMIVSK